MGAGPRVGARLGLLLAGVAACFDPRAIGMSAPPSSGEGTCDDLLRRVEQMVPGFGGMFVGEDGKLVVYLPDPSQLAAARAAIEAVFGPQQVPPGGVRARRGQYSFSELKCWKERAGTLFRISGVTIVDLDESRNRVAIGVADESAMAAVERALAPPRHPEDGCDRGGDGRSQADESSPAGEPSQRPSAPAKSSVCGSPWKHYPSDLPGARTAPGECRRAWCAGAWEAGRLAPRGGRRILPCLWTRTAVPGGSLWRERQLRAGLPLPPQFW